MREADLIRQELERAGASRNTLFQQAVPTVGPMPSWGFSLYQRYPDIATDMVRIAQEVDDLLVRSHHIMASIAVPEWSKT